MSKVMSERQRYWFEHLQRAGEQQVSLARYAHEQGLAVRQLYGAKTWLVKLGVWPRCSGIPDGGRGEQRAAAPASEFVAVRVLPGLYSVRCCVRHVSGWSMECDHWPDVSWLRSLVAVDAAA